jgi:predicted nucleotidyltransferase
MKPSEALERHREDIRRVVEANRATNPRVFGSVLYGKDTEESDLDILVDTIKGATSLFDIVQIKADLEDMMNVAVDVRTPLDLPEKFRFKVLAEAMPV